MTTTIHNIGTIKTKQKTVELTFAEAGDSALEEIIFGEASRAKRLLYLGPTATQVIRAYNTLKPRLEAMGKTVLCFTARMTPMDRASVQQQLFALVGKQADEDSDVVCFATSIVRESLDLSFDSMVTFPMLMPDLIQAVGRLDRFERPSRIGLNPQVIIQKPFAEIKNDNMTGISLGPYDYIVGRGENFGYRKFYALNTYFLLLAKSVIRLPFDAQVLVDACFDLSSGYPALMEESWREHWDRILTKQKGVAAAEQITIAGETILLDFDIDSINTPRELFAALTVGKLNRKSYSTRRIQGAQMFYISTGEDDLSITKPYPSMRELQKHIVSLSNQQSLQGCLGNLIPDAWASSKNEVLNGLPVLHIGVPAVVTNNDNRRRIITYTRERGLLIE